MYLRFVFVCSFYVLIYFIIHLTFCRPKSNKKPSLLQKLYGWLYQIRIALAAPAELVCCANSNSPRLLRKCLFIKSQHPIFGKSRPAVIRTFSVLYFECRGSVQIHSSIIASKTLTCYHTKNIFYISNLIILLSESNAILFYQIILKAIICLYNFIDNINKFFFPISHIAPFCLISKLKVRFTQIAALKI